MKLFTRASFPLDLADHLPPGERVLMDVEIVDEQGGRRAVTLEGTVHKGEHCFNIQFDKELTISKGELVKCGNIRPR